MFRLVESIVSSVRYLEEIIDLHTNQAFEARF